MKSTHKTWTKKEFPEGRRQPDRKKSPNKERKMVTEHALVRYLERVLGLDVEAIRETILTPGQQELVRRMQPVKLHLGGGVYARCENGIVVTII